MATRPKAVIVGGGLAGGLLATYLGREDCDVEVYELRDDLRKGGLGGGRSINLALSYRGIEALRVVGLADEILKMAIPMRGRMIHAPDGRLAFQPYGREAHHANHSLSRNGLNAALLEAASRSPRVKMFFQHKCIDADVASATTHFVDLASGERKSVEADFVLSADGAFSAVRAAMQRQQRFDFSQGYLEHGYKELVIPPAEDGGFRLERNALHIWPRRSFMMIALPNLDGSFTCTLFWPYQGSVSFEAVRTADDLMGVFEKHFADAITHMPTLVDDYFHNPVGSLMTVKSGPWFYGDKLMLLGDAAHAIVPFYGQGMNAAFEDVLVLGENLRRHGPNRGRAFAEVFETRKAHTDVLADLAIGNFLEMRDKTGSRAFRWKKKGEATIAKLLPWWYVPLYTMVSFTRIPYAEAVRRAGRQNRLVILAALLLIVILLMTMVSVVAWLVS